MDSFLDIIQGGSRTKKAGSRRFLVPRSKGSIATETAVFSLAFSATQIDVDLVKVDYINEHAGEIEVTVVRCQGFR